LQSDVSTRVSSPDLRDRLSLSDRHVPLRTGGNGTLMARGSWSAGPARQCGRGLLRQRRRCLSPHHERPARRFPRWARDAGTSHRVWVASLPAAAGRATLPVMTQ
jgi:hypothetical protein